MRPIPGDDARGRPRSSDLDNPSFGLPPAPQMTCFLTDESAIGSSPQPPPASLTRPKDSLRGAPATEGPEATKPRSRPHHDPDQDKEPCGRPSSSKGPLADDLSRGVSPFPGSTDTPNLSQPLTPMLLGASGPASALSSMSSRRNSLCLSEDLDSRLLSVQDGDYTGQIGAAAEPAAAPRADEENAAEAETGPGGASGSSMMDSGCAPQLIMPSIKMPSRRPFTEEGKRMGRLKVLIAGDSGVGKTSLIKAIVQSCEHIVHVDPITPSPTLSSSLARFVPTTMTGILGGSSSRPRKGSRSQPSRERTSTSQITEVYASTKPYPEWWSEVDDLRILRRRKSLNGAVLDRNICFVDTPGYGSGSSVMDTITPVTQYIETHLQRINSSHLSDGEFLNLLGGEGGVQVDVVLYLVSNRLRPVDMQYLRQLAPLTNIIVLLAQTDLMSAEQVASSKEQILSQLKEAEIRPFTFSIASPSYPTPSDPDKQGVYAISCIAGSDYDTMDASLLMSPDYVQPLIPTELSTLVEQVFSPNGVSWLRHSAARKFVQWRNEYQQHPPPSPIPPSLSNNSHNPFDSSLTQFTHHHPPFTPPILGPSSSPTPAAAVTATGAHSYALARLTDHAQREERLAQVRLANWAADLQRSLAREREQYAALARAERAVWLAERLGECVREGAGVGVATGDVDVPGRGGSGLVDLGRGERGRAGEGEGEGAYGGGGAAGSLMTMAPTTTTTTTRQRRMGRGTGRGRNNNQGQGQGQGQGRQEEYCRHCHYRHQHRHHQRQRQRQDPLGLLEVADELRHKGLVALEVIGSLGVLGGLALWVTRQYLPGGWVAGEWERFWYGGR
ncbi:hypothetical protein VTK26DRAFT_7240 [Humicola hyalothermophila]